MYILPQIFTLFKTSIKILVNISKISYDGRKTRVGEDDYAKNNLETG
jgi:hypothetical protein